MPKFLLFYDIITFILFFGVKMNYLPICSFSSGGGGRSSLNFVYQNLISIFTQNLYFLHFLKINLLLFLRNLANER